MGRLIMDVPLDRRLLVALLLVLTAVTGLIDAVSYLRLGHVFVANMTGNVVFLGLTLQPGSGLSPLASVIAIAGFLTGALAGGRLGTRLGNQPRRWLITAFTTQAGLLAATTTLASLGVLAYHGGRALITTAVLAVSFGLPMGGVSGAHRADRRAVADAERPAVFEHPAPSSSTAAARPWRWTGGSPAGGPSVSSRTRGTGH